MTVLTVPATMTATLNWDYVAKSRRILDLYETAKQSQWNASTDIAWDTPVEFGAALGTDSAFGEAARRASPLAHGGQVLWDRFRWEHQAWMVSQFLHGEQGALVASARLVEVLEQLEAKCYAASQAADEARHVEAFSRYLRDHVPHPYRVDDSLAKLLTELLSMREWDMTVLGMQVIIEPLALGAFRLAETTLHDPLISQIVRYVARDEARHVAFGVQLLRPVIDELSAAERKYREEFVLTAIELMARRMLLEDIWERLGVGGRVGADFARTNEMMLLYRRATFSKVVAVLGQLGLMTQRVRSGLSALSLLRPGEKLAHRTAPNV